MWASNTITLWLKNDSSNGRKRQDSNTETGFKEKIRSDTNFNTCLLNLKDAVGVFLWETLLNMCWKTNVCKAPLNNAFVLLNEAQIFIGINGVVLCCLKTTKKYLKLPIVTAHYFRMTECMYICLLLLVLKYEMIKQIFFNFPYVQFVFFVFKYLIFFINKLVISLKIMFFFVRKIIKNQRSKNVS